MAKQEKATDDPLGWERPIAIVQALVEAIDHLESCGTCGEDSLSACVGGQAAIRAREAARVWLQTYRRFVTTCEGCGLEVETIAKSRSRVYADPPQGWSQRGESRYPRIGKHVRLANWCPSCRRAGPGA